MSSNLYTVAKIASDAFHVIKYDSVLRWEELFYTVKMSSRGNLFCDCQAGRRSDCRHRDMVRLFVKQLKVGSGELFNFDRQEWV